MTPLTAFGSKIGLHSIRPQRVLPMVRQARERGFTWPVVKAVDNLGVCLDVKAASPRTLTIHRFVTPAWDSAQGVEGWDVGRMVREAREVIQYLFDRSSPEERRAVDYWEVLNEADPPSPGGWGAFGVYLKLLVQEATARGIRVATPGFNYGTPEWDEMQALVKTGMFAAMKLGGHILTAHEGVNPHGSEVPTIDVTIPGSPAVPGAGPLYWRYRYLYHLLKARDEVVPLVVSEFYAGGGYEQANLDDIRARLIRYDTEVRKDPYVLAFLPFTLDPDDTWRHQDYTPILDHQFFYDYMTIERFKPNGVLPLPDPAPRGYTHLTTAAVLNVRRHPWAGFKQPELVRQLREDTPVLVHGWYRDDDMKWGWACISDEGDQWVSGQFLRQV